jgi:hypothetical protein
MGISISSSSSSGVLEHGPGLLLPRSPEIAHNTPPGVPAAHPKANEGADDYPGVVVVLDAHTRVIECAARIQWIIQSRRGDRWTGVSFCRTKEALLRLTGSNHPALLELPDRFPE